MNLLLFLLPLAVLALLMRQQQRRLRQHQTLIAGLVVGDEVVTTSGIFGIVTDLDDDIAMLEVAPGVTLKVAKRAIGGLISQEYDDDTDGEEYEDTDSTGADSEGDSKDSPESGPVQDAS
jgi:preprotein translocase subunit YajC